MKPRPTIVPLVVALALSACDSTRPETFPDLVGIYTFDALFRDALASDVRARGRLTFTHVDSESGRLIGDADVQLTVTGEQGIRFTAFELATVTPVRSRSGCTCRIWSANGASPAP